jgi:predicted Zn-dependent peptidase
VSLRTGRRAALLFLGLGLGLRTAAGAVPPERTVLASGIPLIFQRDAASAVTVVALIAPGGRAAVPRGLDGLATLTTRLALEIPDEEKVRDLMAQATRTSFVCAEDFSAVVVECLSKNLEAALKVTGRIVTSPLLSGLRVSRAKELLSLYAREEADDPASAAHAAVLAGFFGGVGVGSALYGTEESLKAVDRKDVQAFFRSRFVRSSVFLVAVSDLDPGTVRGLLEKSFSGFPDAAPAVLAAAAPEPPADRDIRLDRDTERAFIGRAFPLPPPSARDHALGTLLETAIGRGPGSRLWRLRSEDRLAYTVDARLTWTRGGGVLEVFLETSADKAGRAEQALDGILERLRTDGLQAGELEAAKAMAAAGHLRAVEGKAARVRFLAGFEVLGLGFGHVAGLEGDLDAVSGEALDAYIKSVLAPERAIRIVVGPVGPAERK